MRPPENDSEVDLTSVMRETGGGMLKTVVRKTRTGQLSFIKSLKLIHSVD